MIFIRTRFFINDDDNGTDNNEGTDDDDTDNDEGTEWY